jgi:hypothetical protein
MTRRTDRTCGRHTVMQVGGPPWPHSGVFVRDWQRGPIARQRGSIGAAGGLITVGLVMAR